MDVLILLQRSDNAPCGEALSGFMYGTCIVDPAAYPFRRGDATGSMALCLRNSVGIRNRTSAAQSWQIFGSHTREVRPGPSRKTPWRFALRTDAEALTKFWQSTPEAGFHDIFGLVKIGRGKIDGDILSPVKKLRCFQEMMTLARPAGELSV